MVKYYTRACNFYYGLNAKKLINQKKALPLCGNQKIAFDQIEIFTRKKRSINSKVISLKEIKNLRNILKKKINQDIKKITKKKKNFLKNLSFFEPSIMGILNLTPDSFSDGGKYNNSVKANKHIISMINSGAKIIDIGGESTRPGSKTIPIDKEWHRIKNVIKDFKKNSKK